MLISVTINDNREITGWAAQGGLGDAIEIDVDAVPDELAAGYYTLSEPPVDEHDQPLEPYEIVYDAERHRVVASQHVPVPSDLCKPWFDLDAGAWIETATTEELAEWTPPAPPEPLPDKAARLEQEAVTTMLGLTEAYELIVSQQAMIDELKTRVEALEGGGA